MSLRTNKSFTKRLKLTKNGRVLARKKGQNHYNAKEGGRDGIKKRNYVEFKKLTPKLRSRMLPGK